MTYTVNYTDKTKTPITIEDGDVYTALGISLFGRNETPYGQDAQNNLIHLLESFAAPESSTIPDTPDLTKVFNNSLTTPIEGHLWYNISTKTVNYYNGTVWQPLANRDDLASNWGTIVDGGTIPKPVSKLTGKTFDYDECVWIVSPYNLPQLVDGFNCTTDDNAVVNMKFKSGATQISGIANYMIVGLSGNRSQRQQTLSYTLNNTSTNLPISSTTALAAQCVPSINGNLAGMNCSGTTNGCIIADCAPRTGINFSLSLSGGVAPYTATLVNITRNELVTECVSFGYDNISEKIHTSATTTANAILADMGSNTFGPLSILSDCGASSVPITGVLTIAVSDSVGHTRNIFINYMSERLYPTNPVNEAPYTTDSLCGPTGVANLIPLGSPNYLFVQNVITQAKGNSTYYMTKNFNIPNTGIYTMKIYHDDIAWVYLDGALVYNSTFNPPCTGTPGSVNLNMSAGAHQILIGYENVPDNSPGYVVFSIYDPSNTLFYTSNKNGWLALTATTGISS